MPFTARDLRYHPEETYPALHAYLARCAQHYLGSLKYDPVEPELVINHVIDQLIRLGLLGGGDRTPLCVLDQLSNAQFYSFLHNSCKNKAIDRLRKRRPAISNFSDLEASDREEGEDDPLNEAIDPLWGVPFATPEEITLVLATQSDLRQILIHCLSALKAAPKQLYAMIQELKEVGADEVLQDVVRALQQEYLASDDKITIAHMSQHKDHAHKKLRHCLQAQSSNLTVRVALRLTEYGTRTADPAGFVVALSDILQDDLSAEDARTGLRELASESLLDWRGDDTVYLSDAQMKHLTRFYREE
ncbi:MAG TPA: hypothetical protein VNE61_09975 [Ktedonobacteraceae bacterium]|nr:hypothetical protein [Ktedonobacteraceae bacterium]